MQERYLEIYKISHNFVLKLYKLTDNFPAYERYRLTDQILRSAISIPANISEGVARSSTRDYIRFLYIARGSINELKYYLLLSRDLDYLSEEYYDQLFNEVTLLFKMLNSLITSLKKKSGLLR